jgi:hypothetical protein
MHTLLKPASAILVVSAIAIALVSTPSPRPLPPPPSAPIDFTGPNAYNLDWKTIYPGPCCHGIIVMAPGVVSVGSLGDALRWVESMPSGTILGCSRYQAEIVEPASLRVFAPGQFEFFLRVCRRRGIRVIVDEWLPPSAR